MIGEKNNQYAFRVMQDATKGEVKSAIETLFKVDVTAVNVVNLKGKAKRFRQGFGSPQQHPQGVREPCRRARDQFRGDQVNGCRETETDLAGPPGDGQGRQSGPAQGRTGCRTDRAEEARFRPEQPRPHHDPASRRRPQAPLPDRRLPPQQGRDPGEGGAAGVRPEPDGQPRAAVLRGRRAPLHPRAARCRCRRGTDVGFGGADPRRQYPADPQHPGRLDDPLHRDAAGQGRSDRPIGGRVRAAACA